jgi:hypothetical protein
MSAEKYPKRSLKSESRLGAPSNINNSRLWIVFTLNIFMISNVFADAIDPADLILTQDDLGDEWIGGYNGGYYGHFYSAKAGFQYRIEIEKKMREGGVTAIYYGDFPEEIDNLENVILVYQTQEESITAFSKEKGTLRGFDSCIPLNLGDESILCKMQVGDVAKIKVVMREGKIVSEITYMGDQFQEKDVVRWSKIVEDKIGKRTTFESIRNFLSNSKISWGSWEEVLWAIIIT